VLARGSDYVCTLAGRLNDALLHNEVITDRALRQASVAERPVALPPVDPTKGATHGLTAFHLSTNSSESPHRRRDRRAKPSRSWTLKVDCPYCGAVHEISVREAYIDSAIHAATDRLDRV
jgi:hypothetical protein